MRTLVKKIKGCDGRFCEDVMIYALGITVFYIMALSVSQLTTV